MRQWGLDACVGLQLLSKWAWRLDKTDGGGREVNHPGSWEPTFWESTLGVEARSG